MNEPKAWRDIWSAGQGVNLVKSIQPVHSLINELKTEYEEALKELSLAKEKISN